MSSKKAKSLFTGKTKTEFIHNPRAINELHSYQTRYFRRIAKRKGAKGLLDVLKNNMTSIKDNLVIK
jgi:hypothetical protein